jgi:hypothetical protein
MFNDGEGFKRHQTTEEVVLWTERVKRMRSWPISRQCDEIRLEGLRKITINVNEYSQYSRVSNLVTSEHKPHELPFRNSIIVVSVYETMLCQLRRLYNF